MQLPLRYLLVQLTVDNRLLAFRVITGEPFGAGRGAWELALIFGRDKVPDGYSSARATLTLGLGRTYESVLDHNHVNSWKRFLPWPNWCHGVYGMLHDVNAARWTGRWCVFTGIDWPLRISFWRAK